MSKRQIAMVMDLNKCIGCHTCTLACKTQWTNRKGRGYMYWNNVETKPGRGYPRDWEKSGGGFKGRKLQEGRLVLAEDYGIPWEYNFSEALLEGKADHLSSFHAGKEIWPSWGPNWDEDEGDGVYPNSYYFYLPRICNHCTKPACLAACPRKAIYKREEDGIVLIDQKRCRGYRECLMACPYKKVYFNPATNRSEKCIFCYPRIEKKIVNACAAQCVGRIRFVGWRDDKDGPVHKLIEKWKVALPLHPEFGTEPNVFYVPPINTAPLLYDGEARLKEKSERIPVSYLESLFSANVRDAMDLLIREMEKRRKSQKSELMDILIGYTNKNRFWL